MPPSISVLGDRLGLHRLVAQDAKLNLIAIGIEPPVIEGEHGEHPNAAADALNTDPFALEIRRRTNARIDDERAVELIDQPCDKSEIETARHGADRGARSRADVELSLPPGQR